MHNSHLPPLNYSIKLLMWCNIVMHLVLGPVLKLSIPVSTMDVLDNEYLIYIYMHSIISCTFQCDLYCISFIIIFTNAHMLLIGPLKASRGSGPDCLA